jgi:predicted small secreted protein
MLRLSLLALLACALLVTGCGSDTDTSKTYVRKLNAAQTSFATTAGRISQAVTTGSSTAQDRRTLVRYQGAIAKVIADLRAIDVPADVRADHARLVAAMDAFGRDIAQAARALREPTRSRLLAAQTAIQEALPRFNSRVKAVAAAINTKLGAT